MSEGKEVDTLAEIIELQTNAKKTVTDSIPFYARRTDSLLNHTPNAPDSLLADQDYIYGLYFSGKGNLDSAKVRFQKATNSVKSGPLSERQLKYFYWAWDTYLDNEEYGECIAINRRFKSLLAENNDPRLNSIAHSLDKTIYLKTKEFDQALESSSQQIRYLRQTKDTSDIVSALVSRTTILDDIGDDRTEVFRLLDSLEANHHSYSNGINRMLFGQYGVHLFYENRFQEAALYYQKGLKFAKRIEDLPTRRKRTSNIYNNLAEVSLELREYDKAGAYLDTLRAMNVSTLERRQQRAFLRYQLRLSANTNKDINEVLTVLDSINSYQNTTYQEKYTTDLEALKIANANEKVLYEEKQASEFKNFRLKTALIIGVVVAALLAFIGMFLYRQKKYGLERENLMTQQRLLRAQMNPHFTFNTLSVIGEMIDKNPKNAKSYLVKFSRLLASIFENSNFNYVLLEKELDSLKEYMDLQKIRFPESFEYTIQLNDVESDLVFVPGMLLQPIIENSINHGFSGIDYKGEITVDLKFDAKFIQCEIQDNGIGLQQKTRLSERKSSTRLISTFLEKVTKKEFSVINKRDIFEGESGVIVTFSIPYKETLDD